MINPYPTYRHFCCFLYQTRNERKLIPTWEKVTLYIFTLLVITLFVVFILIGLAILSSMMGGSDSRSDRRKYPSNRYKKVVKEGLLWDTTEYHER